MPLHLNSITNDTEDAGILTWILQEGLHRGNEVFATPDGKYLHLRTPLIDNNSQDEIGKINFTIQVNSDSKALEILDADLTLNGNELTALTFFNIKKGSSEANEYYDVVTVGDEQHLEIETVNRHTIEGELIDKRIDTRISIFPFALTVYENIEAFNRWAGFGEGVTVGNTDLKVSGLSDTFAMAGGIWDDQNSDEHYSFLVGTVKSIREVQVSFGSKIVDFIIAMVHTALGTVPVAMSADVFDLSILSSGKIIAMQADVKADLADPAVFRK